MIVYVTGPHSEDLEAIGATLSLSGVDAHLITPEMTCQEIYDEILGCDAVLLVHAGHKEEVVEISTELGIAIALGKPVYAVRSIYGMTSRFLGMEGVRIFKGADQALEAVLADLGETDEQRETGVHELGELGGLGRDPDGGGDPGDVP